MKYLHYMDGTVDFSSYSTLYIAPESNPTRLSHFTCGNCGEWRCGYKIIIDDHDQRIYNKPRKSTTFDQSEIRMIFESKKIDNSIDVYCNHINLRWVNGVCNWIRIQGTAGINRRKSAHDRINRWKISYSGDI